MIIIISKREIKVEKRNAPAREINFTWDTTLPASVLTAAHMLIYMIRDNTYYVVRDVFQNYENTYIDNETLLALVAFENRYISGLYV